VSEFRGEFGYRIMGIHLYKFGFSERLNIYYQWLRLMIPFPEAWEPGLTIIIWTVTLFTLGFPAFTLFIWIAISVLEFLCLLPLTTWLNYQKGMLKDLFTTSVESREIVKGMAMWIAQVNLMHVFPAILIMFAYSLLERTPYTHPGAFIVYLVFWFFIFCTGLLAASANSTPAKLLRPLMTAILLIPLFVQLWLRIIQKYFFEHMESGELFPVYLFEFWIIALLLLFSLRHILSTVGAFDRLRSNN